MIKITILSGFLGSGKTTLLRRLLRHADRLKLGVIVNDMAELEGLIWKSDNGGTS